MKRLLLFASLVTGAPLPAQLVVGSAGGIARVDRAPSGSVTSIAGRLRTDLGRLALRFDGASERFAGVGRTGQWLGSGQWQFGAGGWRIGVGPELRAATSVEGASSRTIGMTGEATRRRGATHFALRLSGGTSNHAGQGSASWGAAEGRVSITLGTIELSSTLATTLVGDSTVRPSTIFDIRTSPDTGNIVRRLNRIHDAAVGVRWHGGRTDVYGELGRQGGSGVLPTTWWRGRAAYRLTPHTAVVLQAHRLAADLLLGLRGGRSTKLGLEFALPTRTRHDESAPPIETLRVNATRVLIVFTLPRTDQATLSGEPTGWMPLPLTRREDGRWQAWLDVAPGTYRVNLSLDGGPWIAPPGATTVRDDFGGMVGLVEM
jgi:hypothetical protein